MSPERQLGEAIAAGALVAVATHAAAALAFGGPAPWMYLLTVGGGLAGSLGWVAHLGAVERRTRR